MRLESALTASREGLMTQGSAISVISDNVSNTETTGFKASRTEFADLMSDHDGIKGGDVLKSGSGAQITSVRTIFNSGTIENTGRSLDVGIDGNGFFMTGKATSLPNATGLESGLSFTRAGNFRTDQDGFLISSDGNYVYGTTTTPATGQAPTLTRLNLASAGSGASATSTASLKGNLPSSADTTTAPTSDPDSFSALSKAAGGNIQNIDVYDSLGTRHNLTLAYFKTAIPSGGGATWTVNAYVDGGEAGGTSGAPKKVGSSTLNFQADGTISTANQANSKIACTPAWSSGAAAGNFSVDLSNYTQYASPISLNSTVQNGLAAGQVTGYSFGAQGNLVAQLSNGQSVSIGTLQLANPKNIDAMKRVGSNSFSPDLSKVGSFTIGSPGSSGLGASRGAALERSTSDITDSFVGLIAVQRGYQANSQMLNAASQLLQQTIGLLK